jgi:hypothetical protein
VESVLETKTATTLKEALEPYEIPASACLGGDCKMCGRPMHLVKVNPYIGFYLHTAKEDIAYCGGLNPLNKGKPLIVQNRHFYRQMLQLQDKWSQLRAAIVQKQLEQEKEIKK